MAQACEINQVPCWGPVATSSTHEQRSLLVSGLTALSQMWYLQYNTLSAHWSICKLHFKQTHRNTGKHRRHSSVLIHVDHFPADSFAEGGAIFVVVGPVSYLQYLFQQCGQRKQLWQRNCSVFACFDDGSTILVIRESALRQVSSPFHKWMCFAVHILKASNKFGCCDLYKFADNEATLS